MFIRIAFMMLLGCGSYAHSLMAVVESKFRPRLRAAFASTICNNSFPDHPLDIWKLGIYEAQIVGKAYAPFKGKRLTQYFLSAQSKSLSRKHNHRSRVWGLCEDGTGWVGSWPAPEPMLIASSDQFAVPFQALQSACAEFRIDYAAKGGGQPKRLRLGSSKPATEFITVDTASLEPGTMAVTCYPGEPKWQGPVMWYFAPVKSGPDVNVPEAERLYGKRDLRQNILAWINAVRVKEGLKPLADDDKTLNSHAQALATRPDLVHDRRELREIAENVKAAGKTFLGENRFRGQSNLEIGWLLWNSPRHRALILSRKGTHIGVGARSMGNTRSGVVIVAH